MHLFLIDSDVLDGRATVRGEEHHHLSRSARLREGDAVLLGDGRGTVYEATVAAVLRDETQCTVTRSIPAYHEAPVAVHVLQGVLKNPAKMDWLVEKVTELGAASITPLLTAHTVARSVKSARLRKLAEEASKQCLRGRIPDVHDARAFTTAVAALRDADVRMLLFHEAVDTARTPETLHYDARPLALFIGPEGGFSDDEVALLRDGGADLLSLGPRRLRGETAAVAATARVMARIERLPPAETDAATPHVD